MSALVFTSRLASLMATVLGPSVVLIVVLEQGWMRRLAVPLDAGSIWQTGSWRCRCSGVGCSDDDDGAV